MTSTDANQLPPRSTVRTVRTVLLAPIVAGPVADGSPTATVQQPSDQARRRATRRRRFAPVQSGRSGRYASRPGRETAHTRAKAGMTAIAETAKGGGR